jgi:copper chaperone CopZ
MISAHVPAMTARQDVRAISATISDVPGVQTRQADLATRTVQVTGSAEPTAITAAGTARTGGRPVDTFSTDTTGLPDATRPQRWQLLDRTAGQNAPPADWRFTHEDTWMAHCHIAEHMHSGMMFSFSVTAGATS